jgi:hypothetical protein
MLQRAQRCGAAAVAGNRLVIDEQLYELCSAT